MAGYWILLAYVAFLILSLLTLFCGHWPIFHGTLLQRINHCCTGETHFYLEKVVRLVCGESGRHALESLEYYCCERPNPILQLFYFAILGGTYFTVVNSSFEYIPGYYVSSIHRYTGTCGVVGGVFLFLMTSFSDPGTITAQNVSDCLSAYPYDGVLYEEKTCPTCNILRPARSKHCSICGRCVARFDHHCGWTNNCIGENNLRYFLAFLFWHCCLCIYGVAVLIGILAGEVKKRGVIRVLTVYFEIDNTFSKLFPHIVQWLMAFYSTQILIVLFLLVISLLLVGFLGYHIYLVVTNTTTNETFKWEDYNRWQVAVASERAETDAQNMRSAIENPNLQAKDGLNENKLNCKCSIVGLFSRNISIQRSPRPLSFSKKNTYNKGVLKNVAEVFVPYSDRKCFSKLIISKLKNA